VRTLRYALWSAAFAFGVAAELVGRPPLPALDAATGFWLLALGLLAINRRPQYAVGLILGVTGTAWFLGTIASWAVFVHRAPLAQLILTYPARRVWPASLAERIGVAVAYGYALAVSLAASDVATISFGVFVLGFALWRYRTGRGPERRARATALAAAAGWVSVLVTAAVMRLAGAGGEDGLLTAYEIVVMVSATGLTVDLLRGKWAQSLVTALVVDLGQPGATGALSARLAHIFDDPTLTVGYWVPGQQQYVDEGGEPITLPDEAGGRAVQLINDESGPLAALIHDPAILDDSNLVEGITAAARLAVGNARLQAEVRTRTEQVLASRRRLVEAADRQRRTLERQLREGTERRLADVSELLARAGTPLAEVTAGLDKARSELRELAQGIHPAILTDAGLSAALQELATRTPIPVELNAPRRRLQPALESAVYFICSEALANVAKYSNASGVRIRLSNEHQVLRIEISDDGIGGADASRGTGLGGLADRVAALGGHLTVNSPAGKGTTLTAEFPLT
jgi:signal transduction histidine kinase